MIYVFLTTVAPTIANTANDSGISDDLKGAVITAVVTGIVSILGFIVTNISMRKNFKNELLKQKDSVTLDKMATVPYSVLDLYEHLMKPTRLKKHIDDIEIKSQCDRNTRDELAKLKKELRQAQDQEMIYNKMAELLNTIYSYGSETAIRIVSHMQNENYMNTAGKLTRSHYRVIAFYILLATQVKYDVTGVMVSPELWYRMRITEYQEKQEEFREENNKIVKELNLNKKMMI